MQIATPLIIQIFAISTKLPPTPTYPLVLLFLVFVGRFLRRRLLSRCSSLPAGFSFCYACYVFVFSSIWDLLEPSRVIHSLPRCSLPRVPSTTTCPPAFELFPFRHFCRGLLRLLPRTSSISFFLLLIFLLPIILLLPCFFLFFFKCPSKFVAMEEPVGEPTANQPLDASASHTSPPVLAATTPSHSSSAMAVGWAGGSTSSSSSTKTKTTLSELVSSAIPLIATSRLEQVLGGFLDSLQQVHEKTDGLQQQLQELGDRMETIAAGCAPVSALERLSEKHSSLAKQLQAVVDSDGRERVKTRDGSLPALTPSKNPNEKSS
eukprot:GHVT01006281.1.p1 GENE.GHVT01006281.1~~GHVT01006281.1.p1  ORF type:complete len:320 (+),score=54.92 GHVT01006281.1:29-988(+)